MEMCERPECGLGSIDEQGFCTACDREPLPPPPRPAPTAPPRPAATGVAQVRPDPWYGLSLVDDLPAPAADAEERPPTAVSLAEERRFCADTGCGRPVGRGQDGHAGRTTGFCSSCGARFDFTRVEGLVIAGRYAVRRLLGQGSFGAAYLAHDRNLDTDVVLKELRTSLLRSDKERDALVGLRHDAIVRILGYEEGQGPTYLVLEFVPGTALSARAEDRLQTLLAHGLRLLQALDYLHDRGLLHCDVKPVNIIRFHETGPSGALDRVRLIDFGSARTLTDRAPVVEYTEEYAPPPGDAEYDAPTPGFDLYGLGKTLQRVCAKRTADQSAPGSLSLALLLERATHRHGPARFTSARQFGEQLSGVIRQVVAAPPTGRRVARASALFGPLNESLHGGIGVARPLGHWIAATVEQVGDPTRERTDAGTAEQAGGTGGGIRLALPSPFSAPGARSIAAALPMPLGDADDRTVPAGAMGRLAECRRLIRAADADAAEQALWGVPLPQRHWLRDWYRALIALMRQDPDLTDARKHFTRVRAALPGELIPQLALGLCAEHDHDHPAAESHYATVFATAPALGAAGFGLARVVIHRTGGAEQAVRIVGELAQEPRFEREARVAAFRLLVARLGPAADADDLAEARTLLDALDVGDTQRTRLSAELTHAAFLRTGDRLALSEAVRALAQHSSTEREFVALVDLANRLRPEPRWPWPTGRGRRKGERRGRSGQEAAKAAAHGNPGTGAAARAEQLRSR
ncbi:tetratricopeptide repeat protein [Streptomyces uncialis]|uniref:tetratricopeptide repeat protein n=1 Tax=Streptomyces uncialis TaxID=1048205 RepID=UPI0037F1B8DD